MVEEEGLEVLVGAEAEVEEEGVVVVAKDSCRCHRRHQQQRWRELK